MKKYKVCGWHAEITTIEVERESATSIWIKRRWTAKRSPKYNNYFDTWADAHEWLLEVANAKLARARSSLRFAQGFYGNVKGLRSASTEQRK